MQTGKAGIPPPTLKPSPALSYALWACEFPRILALSAIRSLIEQTTLLMRWVDAVGAYASTRFTAGASSFSRARKRGAGKWLAANLCIAVVAGCHFSTACLERWDSRKPGGRKETASYSTRGGDEEPATKQNLTAYGRVTLLGILGGSSRSNTPPSRPTRPVDLPRHQGYGGDLDDQQEGICRDIGPAEANATL